jgi:hypothetical protein
MSHIPQFQGTPFSQCVPAQGSQVTHAATAKVSANSALPPEGNHLFQKEN